VTVDDSVVYAGSVIGVDAVRDLAVLEICCGQFNTLLLGGAEDLLPGMAVVTMGYPLGLEGEASTTTGIVSARRFDEEYNAWTIQTDAAINPGNSGGPLLSSNGYVVGINTFVYEVSESGRPVEAMGFAISEQTITPLLPSLKSQELVAVPTATPQPSVTGDVYTSQKYWYSLAIPRGWELYVESDEAVAIWDRWQTGAGVWVLVEEVDVDLYPTITSYAADWAPVAGEGMSNFGITSEGSIRTGKPNEAYEFNSSYLYDNEWWQSTDHWYLLGNLLITVEGSAVEEVWTLDYYSNAKQALLSTLESFNPSGYYAYRGWGYIYQVQYKLAIAEFDKAIDLDPTDADAYYSRGVAYGYLGEYQKAINDYTRVIELDPTYVEAYYNLGVSYDMLYESSKANQDYAKACELDSSFC